MALTLDVAANTRQAQAQVKDLGEALDDTADSLDDLAREGKQSGDKLEGSFRDMVREAEKADKAIDGVGTNAKKGFGKASEAAGEFKQEALSNFSEVTSSFDGSMSSVQDLAQGTLGGLASTGLPGVGIAAGLAAVAIGGISSALGDAEAQRALLAERAADLAQAYIDAGTTVLDALTVADRTAGILTDPDQRKNAEALAETLGGDLPLAVRLLAGDTDALREAQTKAAAAQEYLDGLSAQQIANTGKQKTATAEQADAAQKLIDAVKEQTTVQEMATETAQIQSQIYADLINHTKGVTEEVDALGNRLYTLPDGKQILIDAKTGQASANVDSFKGDVDGIPETVTTTVRVNVDRDDFDRKMRDLQTRANQGISVVLRPGQGRLVD